MRVMYPMYLIGLLYFICYHLYQMKQTYKEKGMLWSKETSAYFSPEGRPEKYTFVCLFVRVVSGILSMIFCY